MSHNRRRILDLITAQSDQAEGCTMSKQAIAQAVHCSVKTVDRAVAYLRADGYITVEQRYDETGAQQHNSYRIVEPEEVEETAAEEAAEGEGPADGAAGEEVAIDDVMVTEDVA